MNIFRPHHNRETVEQLSFCIHSIGPNQKLTFFPSVWCCTQPSWYFLMRLGSCCDGSILQALKLSLFNKKIKSNILVWKKSPSQFDRPVTHFLVRHAWIPFVKTMTWEVQCLYRTCRSTKIYNIVCRLCHLIYRPNFSQQIYWYNLSPPKTEG